MKSLLIFVLLGSVNVFAQEDRSAKLGPHAVSAVASFPQGGFSIGAAYEYSLEDSMGVVGHFRLFSKEDAPKNPGHGLMVAGIGAAHHFYKKSWDLAFTPSINMINIDNVSKTGDDATAFGPGLSVSLLCQMTDRIAAGFEWANYWVWFNEDFAGKRVDDLGLKVRMNF